MWAIWMIIAVAIGGAVSLTTTAVLTVVYFERRRHRRLMERHRLDRNTSRMHRHHLSVTDVDMTSLPRPAKSFRHGYQRPRSESIRFYATIPSQDEIRTFPEGTITESVVDGAHSQLESSHQWLAPSKSGRLKRKKKIAKVVASIPIAKSPRSAITEATESRIETPEPVELPAHITPRMTPEKTMPMSVKIVQDFSIDSVMVASEPVGVPRISHGMFVKSRSISGGSIVSPPNIPLPPIPDTLPYDPQRQASLTRSKSDISLHRRSVSAVSPTKAVKNGFCGFRFELTGEDLLKKNIDPVLKPSQPSFRFPQPEMEQDPEETFKTIDASTWNLPKSLRTSRPITPTLSPPTSEAGSRSVSMIDYDAIFSAGSSLNNSPTRPYEGPLSRPVSALSVSSTDMFRLSVIGSKIPESPRNVGHKRQNCVRIKNLTPIDSKKRLSSQLGRLAEAEEDDASILLPSPSRVSQIQSASASDSSLIAAAEVGSDGVNGPVVKQPHALSLRVKHPGWTSIKDKNKQPRPLPTPTPHDPVKQDQTPPAKSNPTNNPPHQSVTSTSTSTTPAPTKPIPPTILEAIQTSGSNTKTPISSSSLTRIFSPDSLQRQRTQIQGPRNAPPSSLRVRNQTRGGSPFRRKSSDSERADKRHHQQHQRDRERKTSDTDLRKSIAILRGMTLPETTGVSAATSATAPAQVPTQTMVKLTEHPQTSSQLPLPLPTQVARTPSSRYADSPVIKVPKNRLRSNTVAGHPGERALASNSPPLQRRDLLAVQTNTNTNTNTTGSTPATPGRFNYSPSSVSIWEDESIRGESPESQLPLQVLPSTRMQTQQQPSLKYNPTTTSTTSSTNFPPSENNPPSQPHQSQSQQQSGRFSPVKSHRAHFDQLSTKTSTSTSANITAYSRTISSQQYHQHQTTPPSQNSQMQLSPHSQQIQRESLWKLQRDADVITGRALTMSGAVGGGGSGGGGKIRGEKRGGVGGSPSPRAKVQGNVNVNGNGNTMSAPVPAGLRIVTQMSMTQPYKQPQTQSQTYLQAPTSTREDRGMMQLRSHTVSVAPRGMGQTQGQTPTQSPEGVGLGLKFGERSMAYTVNEIGMGRARWEEGV